MDFHLFLSSSLSLSLSIFFSLSHSSADYADFLIILCTCCKGVSECCHRKYRSHTERLLKSIVAICKLSPQCVWCVFIKTLAFFKPFLNILRVVDSADVFSLLFFVEHLSATKTSQIRYYKLHTISWQFHVSFFLLFAFVWFFCTYSAPCKREKEVGLEKFC